MYDDPSIISPFHVLIPAGLALVILAIAWNPWNRKATRACWAGPAAIAVAFLGVFQWIVGSLPGWVPNDAVGWTFHIAIGMGLLAILDAILARRVAWYWRLSYVTAGFIVAFLLIVRRPFLDPERHYETAGWILMTAGFAAVWWFTFRERGERPTETRALAPFALTLLGIAAALTQVASGSVLYTRLTLAVAAATGAIGVVALLRKDHVVSPAVSLATVLILGLLLAGHFFAEVTTTLFIAIAAAPVLILALQLLTPLSDRRPVLYQLLSITLLVVTLAVFVAPLVVELVRNAENPSNPYGM